MAFVSAWMAAVIVRILAIIFLWLASIFVSIHCWSACLLALISRSSSICLATFTWFYSRNSNICCMISIFFCRWYVSRFSVRSHFWHQVSHVLLVMWQCRMFKFVTTFDTKCHVFPW
jgi:hypothetical protein